METIGEKIKYLRKERNLTQTELAKKIGVAFSVISNWENNTNFPRGDYVALLANAFNVTTDYLLGQETDYDSQILPADVASRAVTFANEYSVLFDDDNYINMSKLYKSITPELRALALGYLVGLLQNNGVNTKKILGY